MVNGASLGLQKKEEVSERAKERQRERRRERGGGTMFVCAKRRPIKVLIVLSIRQGQIVA